MNSPSKLKISEIISKNLIDKLKDSWCGRTIYATFVFKLQIYTKMTKKDKETRK